jgi:hypothetical protein
MPQLLGHPRLSPLVDSAIATMHLETFDRICLVNVTLKMNERQGLEAENINVLQFFTFAAWRSADCGLVC